MIELESEHGPLLKAADSLCAALHRCEDGIEPVGQVEHLEYRQFGRRATLLGVYLHSVLALVRANAYAPAFALLRVALEHHTFDRLLFLADRYEQVFPNVTEETWQQWQAHRAAGAEGMEDIVSWTRQKSTVRVVRRGIMVGGEPNRTLSPYYYQYTNHDPFVGTPAEQAGLTSDFSPLEDREKLARDYEGMRSGRLGWQNLKRNLLINQMASERELDQLQVHYRFLGAFVHPTSERGEAEIYGYSDPTPLHQYNHFSSELCLLYAVTLAVNELSALSQASEREPRFRIRNWEALAPFLAHARALTDHLWWPGGVPHQFDRIHEANDRLFDHDRGTAWVPRGERMPANIPDDEIHYYRNPLHRIIRMHGPMQEATGFGYTPPPHWLPRQDYLRRA